MHIECPGCRNQLSDLSIEVVARGGELGGGGGIICHHCGRRIGNEEITRLVYATPSTRERSTDRTKTGARLKSTVQGIFLLLTGLAFVSAGVYGLATRDPDIDLGLGCLILAMGLGFLVAGGFLLRTVSAHR